MMGDSAHSYVEGTTVPFDYDYADPDENCFLGCVDISEAMRDTKK